MPSEKKQPEKRYLGDGVYVSTNGYSLVLTTGSDDPAKADNVVCLEPDVLEELNRYVEYLKVFYANTPG